MSGREPRRRKSRLQEFHLLSSILLSSSEKQILYKILRDYQRRRSVQRLVQGIRLVLRSPDKLVLIRYVRLFVVKEQIPEFDQLTSYRSRFGGRPQPGKKRRTDRAGVAPSIASTSTSGQVAKDVKVITIHRDPRELSLGFSVRGGSEHGLGIYVSEIDKDSVADQSGLELGDKILEVNNISMNEVASSSAVKVLTGSQRLKLVIQRTHKVPEWRLSREKTSWYDVHDDKLISGQFEECGITHYIRGLDVDMPERRVNLKFGKDDKTLGFNIRGGTEYGLGIYVSRVDAGGMAETSGVHIGDQIIDVNGIPFTNITHGHAVEVLRDRKHLILTLRDVGRYPAYKELYAEYTWSDGQVRSGSVEHGLPDTDVLVPQASTSGSLPNMRATSLNDLFSKNKRPSGVPLQSDIFLPSQKGQGHFQQEDHLDHLSDSGSESSFNLEQWSEHITDPGNLNPGYVSDSELEVMVHHPENDSTSIQRRERTQDEPNTIFQQESTQGQSVSQLHPTDSQTLEASDFMYAKIERKNDGHTKTRKGATGLNSDTDTDSDSDNEGHYQISPRKGSSASVSFLMKSYAGGGFELNKEVGPKEDEIVTFISAKDRQDLDTGQMSQPQTENGLYSQVQRLSVESTSSRISPTDGLLGSSPRLLSPRLNDITSEREETLSVVQSANTLQIRVTESTPVKTINRPNLHGGKQSPSKLKVSDFNGNPYDISESEGQDSSLGVSFSGHHGDTGSDENFSVYDLDKRIKDLEARQMTIGQQELDALESPEDMWEERGRKPSVAGTSSSSVATKKSKWKNFKNKIKGSLRLKSPKREHLQIEEMDQGAESVRRKGVFERGFGGHVIHQNTVDGYSLAVLEDAAHNMLPHDEFEAVMRHIKIYLEKHELERLVEVLLTILDKPEKLLLLREVRGVVYPMDMVQFDNMVNKYEIEAYETLSLKLHLPLNHSKQRKPRKTLMTTQIAMEPSGNGPYTPVTIETSEGDNGHFHIRPINRDTEETEAKVNLESDRDSQSSGSSECLQMTEQSGYKFNMMESPKQSGSYDPTSRQSDIQMSSSSRPGSGGQSGSRRSAAVNSITDQFGYLDQEASDEGISGGALSDFGSEDDEMTDAIVVHLSKHKPTLGLELCEGYDPKLHSIVCVQSVQPLSAAADESTVQTGMVLLAVDGHSLLGCSQSEASAMLKKSFEDKHHVSMKLDLLPDSVDTHF